MKQVVAIFLCFLMFSAFDWGRGEKPAEEKTSKKVTRTYNQETSHKKVDPAAKSAGTVTKGSMNPEAVATAVRVLGSGTPEEQQARMDSLKRLGDSLRKKQS